MEKTTDKIGVGSVREILSLKFSVTNSNLLTILANRLFADSSVSELIFTFITQSFARDGKLATGHK
ncbi:hypothetical protein DERP_004340 [Dermatophagoides pteronyssinus]|uniref:Uncharacterized protein n=1 Tax=Dermatophagoides pteronyssinus TaxID=6956 RepID=A0ABQ8JP19_DERPT|nr:hypothetical protein DERP_004340 [Dermatophagoides pteronyssinus]